jgi:8-oxo-dGTP pyrophosphatase MutT (NUDIX family)
MSERLTTEIQNLMTRDISSNDINIRFASRLEKGNFTRDENPKSHFCAYFAGFDPKKRKLFIGHHIKSDYWLFNGGHLDKGELPEETLAREIKEEWGNNFRLQEIPEPSLLTITQIDNEGIACKTHYDIWYFIRLDSDTFDPDKEKLATEFYQTGWKTIGEAKELIVDKNTLLAIDKINQLMNKE